MAYYCYAKNRKETSKAIIEDNLTDKISITRHARQLIELYESILKKR